MSLRRNQSGGAKDTKGTTWAALLARRREVVWVAAIFLLVFMIFMTALSPQRILVLSGDVSPVDIKAPREVIDTAATDRLREKAAANVPEQWEKDPKVLSDILERATEFRVAVGELQSGEPTTKDIIDSLRPYLTALAPDADLIAIAAAAPEVLDAGVAKLSEVLDAALAVGVKPEDLAAAVEDASERLKADQALPSQISKALALFITKNLRANWVLNVERTDAMRRDAASAVEPVRIRKGQFIVKEGEIVTDDQMEILDELGMVGPRVRFAAVAGALVMAVLIFLILGGYIWMHHPGVVETGELRLLLSVLGLMVILVYAVSRFAEYLIPTATGVLLISTLFDRKFGVLFGACLTLVVGTITGFDVRFMAISLAGALVASLALRPDFNRMRLIQAGFIVSLGNLAAFFGLGLTGTVPFDDILSWRDMLMVTLAGPLSAVLAVGFLPFFESAFGIITPIRLLELASPAHPLLNRLLLEAPGTYHHSIMVANLAEAAAMAIGANSLLARVGAYYHDIGKIKRPYFFAENQIQGMDNPHDKMAPTLSATVITSHVKDGLELAAEHKVPPVIMDFIAEHHGTSLVSFFYNRAAEATKDSRAPDEFDFRYEGPRPSKKETAVVMLADSVEATTRSLSKATPARIESVVRKTVSSSLLDHQLDRSDLTLRELDIVSETFVRVLAGMFHTRIEYPEPKAK